MDGQTVEAAKKSFDGWIEPMLQNLTSLTDLRPVTEAVQEATREGAEQAGCIVLRQDLGAKTPWFQCWDSHVALLPAG